MQAFWSDMVSGALSQSVIFMSDFSPVIILGLAIAVFGSFLMIFKGDK